MTRSENNHLLCQKTKRQTVNKCRNDQNPREWVQTWSIRPHSHQYVLPCINITPRCLLWWKYPNSLNYLNFFGIWKMFLMMIMVIITVLPLVFGRNSTDTVFPPECHYLWMSLPMPNERGGRIHLQIKVGPIQKITPTTYSRLVIPHMESQCNCSFAPFFGWSSNIDDVMYDVQ